MLRAILSLTVASLLALTGSTQTGSRAYSTCAYGEGNHGLEKCKEFQADLAYSEAQAGAAVDRILKQIGLGAQRNFVLIPCVGIDGALAGVEKQGDRIIRIIWYDPTFMARLNRSANSDSPSWSILAHEIAHHFHNHMLSASDLEQSRRDELAADRFSGFILYKLGASLKQAQDALKAFPDVYDERFSRHPKHERRRAEIADGYYEAASEQARPDSSRMEPSNIGQLIIDVPQSGATVDIRTEVRGRTPHPELNHYIVARSAVAKRLFIQQPVRVRSDGTWEGTAAFGTPTYGIGHQWSLRVFATRARLHVGEIFQFPEDAIVSGEILVTRVQ